MELYEPLIIPVFLIAFGAYFTRKGYKILLKKELVFGKVDPIHVLGIGSLVMFGGFYLLLYRIIIPIIRG